MRNTAKKCKQKRWRIMHLKIKIFLYIHYKSLLEEEIAKHLWYYLVSNIFFLFRGLLSCLIFSIQEFVKLSKVLYTLLCIRILTSKIVFFLYRKIMKSWHLSFITFSFTVSAVWVGFLNFEIEISNIVSKTQNVTCCSAAFPRF